jgi:glucokinase
MKQSLAAGIDIGGTNVVLGLVDLEGKIIWKDSFSTKKFSEFQSLVNHASELILHQINELNQYHLIGCGVGAPNGNYFTGCIEHAPNLVWKGIVPVTSLFEQTLKVKSIVTNDANAAALGEHLYGAAKTCKDFIFITLGTGLGSGIFVNGELVYGHDGFAGEMGHVIVEKNGRPCGCGRKGCLETYCSATGIVTTYAELKSEKSSPINASQIFARAAEGESEALKAFSLTGEILGLALANAAAYTSPAAIFLFGGLARAGNFLLEPTRNSFKNNLHIIYRNKVEIYLSELNENDGAILGAASLIWKNYVAS